MNTIAYSERLRLAGILLLSLFLCLGYEHSAWAVNEYYSISRSVRSLGMGGAFYGLSDDEHALFYNPAGLSRYEGGSQFKLQVQGDMATQLPSVISTFTNTAGQKTTALVNDFLKYEGTPLYANATPAFLYYLHKHLAVGLLVADTKVDIAMLGRDLDTGLDLTAISDSGLIIGYADEFFPHLHLGANVKGILRAGGTKSFSLLEILQNNQVVSNLQDLGGAGFGVDFDLGATYELPDLPFAQESVSLVLNNLLASKFSIARVDGAPPGLPRLVTLAGQMRLPGYGLIHHFDFVLDLAEFEIGGETNDNLGARYGAIWKHVNFGIEVPIGWFYVRGGIHQGDFTAGLGADLRFLRLDLATYAEEDFLNPGQLTSRRVALSLAFGWGGAAPEPVVPETSPSEQNPEEKAPNPSPEQTQPTQPAPANPAPHTEPSPDVAPPVGGPASAPTTQQKARDTQSHSGRRHAPQSTSPTTPGKTSPSVPTAAPSETTP